MNDELKPEQPIVSEDDTIESIIEQPKPIIDEPKLTETASETPRQSTVRLTSDYSTPKAADSKPLFGYTFTLPSETYPVMLKAMTSLDDTKLEQNNPDIEKWKKVLSDSTDAYTPSNMYNENFTRPGSSYEQGILDANKALITLSSINLKDKVGDLRGEAALLKLAVHLGLGDLVKVPLPHSGIWVHIKPPGEKDLIDFYNGLFRDKVSLGRSSSGFVLSNFAVYTNEALINFIISHIHSTNIIGLKIEQLKEHVYLQDLQILAWGLARAIYPNGFDYQRACINNPAECHYVAQANISLEKLLMIDNSAYSEYQRIHMCSYEPNSRSMDQLIKFREEHTRIKNAYFTTPNGIKFNLKPSMIQEHLTSGIKWVDYIVTGIEAAVLTTDDKGTQEKEKLLQQYVKASVLRQYGHFIASIDISDSNVSDVDTLEKSLDLLSGDDNIRNLYVKEVNKYVSDSTFGLIGIPKYECPECKKNQNPDPVNPRLVDAIPLDVFELFFGLVTLRISRILERSL